MITDVGLPGGLNGRQVADRAREMREGLKVLFITGYAENAAISNHLEAGMSVLAKPFAMSTVANKVREMIEGRTASHPSDIRDTQDLMPDGEFERVLDGHQHRLHLLGYRKEDLVLQDERSLLKRDPPRTFPLFALLYETFELKVVIYVCFGVE